MIDRTPKRPRPSPIPTSVPASITATPKMPTLTAKNATTRSGR
ncbi:MAG: hypothetical protein SPK00_01495 [Corynebacterium glucuronolyticum]|nr:hypothetical protein [Mycobacteriaceae bacterium]MDY5833416.1 hypothetical protein [Corynebacterium glucuronolyticum]